MRFELDPTLDPVRK